MTYDTWLDGASRVHTLDGLDPAQGREEGTRGVFDTLAADLAG